MDRQSVMRLLGPNYTVIQAKTANDAIEACRTFRPDCILVDYRLPDMDGIDLVKALAPSKAAMVMLTGGGDEAVAVEAMKAGALDYITKDRLDAMRLETAISKACDRSKLERQLAETRQELEDFAGIAAHDLKSPLATIVGYLRIASEAASGSLPEQEKGFIDRSAELAGGLIVMIDQLIRYTKTGRNTAELDEVDLGKAARAAVDRVQDAIEHNKGTVEVGDLPVVRGVENDLIQLLQNLITNALKFHGETPPLVRVYSQVSGERELTVSVEDNGIGISEEHRETIFAPLSRLHTVEEYAGHGLGLATCRKIVAQHGGRIWVDAAEGGGSIFRFTLQQSEQDTDASSNEASGATGM